MNAFARWTRKLAMLLGRGRFRSELDEEMAFHREQAERELVVAGMSPELAHYEALRRFGNSAQIQQRSFELVGFRFESVAQDVRFTLRQMWRSPGFAAMAVLIIALGVGASASIFAFVDAALIQPLPYPNATRLVHVTEAESGQSLVNLSYPDFTDWRQSDTTLASLDAFTNAPYSLSTPTGAEPIHGARVSAGFFQTLGVAPVLGRDFMPGEDKAGAPGVVMLSYSAWQRRFGARQDIVGRPVMLSGVAHTIIGVLPRDFVFALAGDTEVWTALQPVDECQRDRGCHSLYAVGRLKDGVTVAAARTEMQHIARRLEAQYPDSNRGRGASVKPLAEQIVGDIRPILLVLLWGAALLLLIACVNVSSLLLVRSEGRRREMAVRGALGASPARLRRQFVTEAILLSFSGCFAGLGFALGGMQILRRLLSKDTLASVPSLGNVGLNAHLILFTATLVLLAALLFSAMPVLHFRSADMRDGLSAGARGATGSLWRKLGANLVIVELATATVLLTGAGLLTKSLYKLLHTDIGFAPDHIATVSLGLPEKGFEKDEAIIAFERRLLERVSALPGVQSAGATSLLPVKCGCNTDWIRFADRPYHGGHITVMSRNVSPGYFTTLRTRLVEGNYFDESADESKPKVSLVNRAFARQFFPGESAVGKQYGGVDLAPKSMTRIVGVIENIKDGSLEEEDSPTVYVPFSQSAPSYFSLMVRTSGSPQSLLPEIGVQIHSVSRDAGAFDGATMQDFIDSSQPAYLHRTMAWLVGGFAVMALFLGVVGIYSIIAYTVSRRTREIGVRMALGAQRDTVYKMVLTQAAWLAAIGVGAGLLGSIGSSMLMRKLLFDVKAWDAPTLVAVAVLLGFASLAASFLPARRAASVNPVDALRAE